MSKNTQNKASTALFRAKFNLLKTRLGEKRNFFQVVIGPRQIGKTTLIHQVLETLPPHFHYASADDPGLQDSTWIETQWEIARMKVRDDSFVLALDEIQKITHWADIVKKLWDEDTRHKRPIRVILSGSSSLVLQKGLTESMTGRFEKICLGHWSFSEMKAVFNFSLDDYILFGGYPGPASLIHDEKRWLNYLKDSLIETTISRDILLMQRVDKPALLRRLFELSAHYSGQILSYQKMMGQLQEAGNTTTLAHYLQLLSSAGLISGLEKYAGQLVRARASSPKLQVHNTALLTALSSISTHEIRETPDKWGRWVESAIGAHLINQSLDHPFSVEYWNEGSSEVDFILKQGKKMIAIEVKSGRKKETVSGLKIFSKKYKTYKSLLVGQGGISIQDFLNLDISSLFI